MKSLIGFKRVQVLYRQETLDNNPESHDTEVLGLSYEAQTRLKKDYPGMKILVEKGGKGGDTITVLYNNHTKDYHSNVSIIMARGKDFLEGDIRQDFKNPTSSNAYIPQHNSEIQRLDEAGEKAFAALEMLLSQSGAKDRFLSDPTLYKTIADGWSSNQVTLELADRFKKQVVIPIYKEQGWDMQKSPVKVAFNKKNLLNGLPTMETTVNNTIPMMTIISPHFGQNISVRLPYQSGFNARPLHVNEVIRQQALLSPPVPNAPPNSIPPSQTLTPQEQYAQMVNRLIITTPTNTEYASRNWNLASVEAKMKVFESIKFSLSSLHFTNPINAIKRITPDTYSTRFSLANINPDGTGGFNVTLPIYVEKHGRDSGADFIASQSSYAQIHFSPGRQMRVIRLIAN